MKPKNLTVCHTYLIEFSLVHPSHGDDFLGVRLLHGGHLLLERAVVHLELFHPGDVGGEPVVEVAEGLLLLGPGEGVQGSHGGGWARKNENI